MSPVSLTAYDPVWPALAEAYGKAFSSLGSLLTIHHIGSTSVPGLRAKPTIDLMPVVATLEALDPERAAIEDLGYAWRGEYGITGRRYCTLTENTETGSERRVNAHFFAAGSPQISRHLAFRDYLRSHPDACRAYEAEKRRAQTLYPRDSRAYAREKSGWISAAHDRADAWYLQSQAISSAARKRDTIL